MAHTHHLALTQNPSGWTVIALCQSYAKQGQQGQIAKGTHLASGGHGIRTQGCVTPMVTPTTTPLEWLPRGMCVLEKVRSERIRLSAVGLSGAVTGKLAHQREVEFPRWGWAAAVGPLLWGLLTACCPTAVLLHDSTVSSLNGLPLHRGPNWGLLLALH